MNADYYRVLYNKGKLSQHFPVYSEISESVKIVFKAKKCVFKSIFLSDNELLLKNSNIKLIIESLKSRQKKLEESTGYVNVGRRISDRQGRVTWLTRYNFGRTLYHLMKFNLENCTPPICLLKPSKTFQKVVKSNFRSPSFLNSFKRVVTGSV